MWLKDKYSIFVCKVFTYFDLYNVQIIFLNSWILEFFYSFKMQYISQYGWDFFFPFDTKLDVVKISLDETYTLHHWQYLLDWFYEIRFIERHLKLSKFYQCKFPFEIFKWNVFVWIVIIFDKLLNVQYKLHVMLSHIFKYFCACEYSSLQKWTKNFNLELA